MAFGRIMKIVVLLLFFSCAVLDLTQAQTFIGKCWKTWSRCTQWSSFATGTLWQSCNTRCKCLGRGYGKCVETRSQCPFSRYAWQCRCYGSYGNLKGSWCGL
ncbi:unnamed protein product [Porites lobata]|uniref:Uncharacterized protein n=1 Tax=Porites lobata TaxID=104759 RepID=A0ABN8R1H0_9CNID|nr:unnamed protein product [Porites lobata]